ncbi:unnamed protein product [Musa acuminata subsp. malaccensis]|uniref:(wild Malaysian banana) hypothetical protein n=1 Tax=Musa acuminata subsp. malaccensis TaxID=214687 RepID=A0A804ISI7_MUSAM|nr:unnamed protein product [Musa acuminata subsp. malaccensis]
MLLCNRPWIMYRCLCCVVHPNIIACVMSFLLFICFIESMCIFFCWLGLC